MSKEILGTGALCGVALGAQQAQHPSLLDVLQQRGVHYGTFKSHAQKAQELKATFRRQLGESYGQLAPDQLEALDMIAHKLARIFNGDPNYADSWVDIAGYAQLVADRLQGTAR